MSNSITLPASMLPPAPPPGALTDPDNPTESVVHYQLSSGHVASLPQSSVPALIQQDKGAKQIPSPADGEVLVQLSSGHTATVPSTSLSALKQQDPNYKYIAGNTSAAPKELTPGFDAISAVMGPTTALGTPLSPEATQEGSGVSDILHGNFRQGAGKIYDAEKPHVIQGSLLEEAIQKVDPNFQGSASPADVAAHNAQYNALDHPLVDVSQSIDKSQHPVAKAIAETTQSLTTPATIATLYATGGLGLVDNPAALGFAGRLISGGFSAVAIGNAYKDYKGFRDAVDRGDWPEAEYQITHAVTSGVLGVLAARGAVKGLSLPPNPFRAKFAAATTDAAAPSFYQKVTQGENVAQVPAQAAVRSAVKSGGAEVGLATAQPESLRTTAEQPISVVNGLKKSLYGQVDQAAGTDLKALSDKLDAINDKIDLEASGSPEEARLEAQRVSQMQTIEDAKTAARAKGVDVDKLLDQADALHTKEMALRDFQKSFLKNPSIVEGNSAMGTPETIKVDSGIKTLQKLQDNTKFGAPRLEQALGKSGANQILKSMYAAQRAGREAVSLQDTLGKIQTALKWAGIGVAALGGADLVKKMFE